MFGTASFMSVFFTKTFFSFSFEWENGSRESYSNTLTARQKIAIVHYYLAVVALLLCLFHKKNDCKIALFFVLSLMLPFLTSNYNAGGNDFCRNKSLYKNGGKFKLDC